MVAAQFATLETSVSASTILELFRATNGMQLDSCIVALDEDIEIPEEISIFPVDVKNDLDAGDILTLTSRTGSWGELVRRRGIDNDSEGDLEPDEIYYELDYTDQHAQIPDGLLLDIPGSEFPPFPNVAIPDIDPFELISPADLKIVSAQTTFTWLVGEQRGDSVDFALNYDNGIVACLATDDGEFSLPENVLDAVPPNSALSFLYAGRSIRSIVMVDDAMLLIVRGNIFSPMEPADQIAR